jgi:hypothetical protein
MSTPGTQPQAAGWYPDPAGSGGHRWHDGQGWTAQVVHPSAVETKPLGAGFARLADWLGRMLAAWGVLYVLFGLLVLALWVAGPEAFAPTGSDGSDLGTTTTTGTGAENGVGLAINLAFLALYVGTIVTWLVWQYQLAVAAPGRLRNSPAGHVGWWFVPFASLVVPRRAIGDLWHAYSLRRAGDPAEPTPWVFSVWWALWISPTVLVPVLVLALLRARSLDGAVSSLVGMTVLMMFAYAFAGFTARLVVRELSWRALLYHSSVG